MQLRDAGNDGLTATHCGGGTLNLNAFYFRRLIWNNFEHTVAGLDRRVTLYTELQQEDLIQFIGVEFSVALNADLALHSAVYNNGFARQFGNRVDKFTDIHILHVEFEAFGISGLQWRGQYHQQ